MKSVNLSELLQEKSVRAESLPDYESLPVLGVSNKIGITVTNHKKSKELAAYKLIEEGDFAYNPYRINVGSIGLTPNGIRGLVSPAYVVFSAKETLSPELLLNFLKSSEGLFQISKYSRGTVRKSLRFKDLCQISIVLPPMEKQRLIFQKREKIQDEEEALKREITLQQTLLKKLRQQILQEAVEGKLTADWRAHNPDVEPASELLARIQAEKEQLIKAKKISKQTPLPPISEEEKPFALPDGWVWCRLEQAGLFERGKSRHRPRNDEALFVDGKYPFVQTGDVAQSKKTGFRIKTFSKSYNEVGLSQSRLWGENTLCITIAANIAETGFLDIEACFPDSVVGFSPLSEDITSKYVKYFIDTTRDEIEKFAPATAQKNINLGIINMLLFPFPPLPEQKAIVAKVEKLLALCDKLEHEISQNQGRAEQLMQAVLSEAFSQHSEQAKQPAAFAERVTKPKLDRLFFKQPADQSFSLIFPIEQQGFSIEAPSFA